MRTKAYDAVGSSAKIEEFSTGAHRGSGSGRGRYDLLPPYAEERDAIHIENGSVKYGDRNWEKGLPLARYIDSAKRHMNAFLAGDRKEDHLAAIRWNIGCYMQTEKWIDEGRLPESLREGCAWPHSLGSVKS
jgi:Domain of unknown function (DUF5664)